MSNAECEMPTDPHWHSASAIDTNITREVMITPSENFVAADSHDLRTVPAVGVDALHAIAPLDREQCAERRRALERGAEAGEIAQSAAEPRIMHLGGIGESVEPYRFCNGPCGRRAQHRAPIIANERRRVSVQTIVERAERVPAEPIEIVAGHPRRF